MEVLRGTRETEVRSHEPLCIESVIVERRAALTRKQIVVCPSQGIGHSGEDLRIGLALLWQRLYAGNHVFGAHDKGTQKRRGIGIGIRHVYGIETGRQCQGTRGKGVYPAFKPNGARPRLTYSEMGNQRSHVGVCALLKAFHDRIVGTGTERRGLHLAYDGESRVDAQLERMLAQNARAHAVDRRYPRVIYPQGLFLQAQLHELALDARFQFGGGLLGEGDCHHFVYAAGECALAVVFQCVGDALGKRERLAASRTRRNHERRIERGDDPALAGCARIQVHESLLAQLATGQYVQDCFPKGSGSI